jgi:N-acetylglucosamine malate deacetylase 2
MGNSAIPDPTMVPEAPLPAYARVGVICAHPDDEAFGLGAIISGMVDDGAQVELVCLTRGEGSTLGAGADLAARRHVELHEAAEELGIARVTLFDHPDGSLSSVPLDQLVDEVTEALGDVEVLLTFDHGGITGHPDHQHATDVTVATGRRHGIPVLGWALPEIVAATLRDEFGAPFVGRSPEELTQRSIVDRTRQDAAIACHPSQHNPVPHRRIELQGPYEYLRLLNPAVAPRRHPPPDQHDAVDLTR